MILFLRSPASIIGVKILSCASIGSNISSGVLLILIFPLPSEIIHILGSEGSVGLEKDEFNLIDSKTLEWNVEYGTAPLKLVKNEVWYIVPTRLTESIFKGCKK